MSAVETLVNFRRTIEVGLTKHDLVRLRLLKTSNHLTNTLWLISDLFLLFLCIVCAVANPILVIISIPIGGSRIRALGNLLHDASHGNFFRRNMINVFVGRFLLAPIIFEGFDGYRESHFPHHKYLGGKDDPDTISMTDQSVGPYRLFFRMLWSLKQLKTSLVGGWFYPRTLADFMVVLTVWSLIFVAALIFGGVKYSLMAGCTILLMRLIWLHPARIFTELSDHAFLPNTPFSTVSRTLTNDGFVGWLLHPHNDGYHLAHHLYPWIGMSNLRSAHAILMSSEAYASTEIVETYFRGDNCLIRKFVENYSQR